MGYAMLEPQNMLLKSRSYKDNYTDKVKCAIYGRVSTKHEAQLSAFDNQLDWYQLLLQQVWRLLIIMLGLLWLKLFYSLLRLLVLVLDQQVEESKYQELLFYLKHLEEKLKSWLILIVLQILDLMEIMSMKAL